MTASPRFAQRKDLVQDLIEEALAKAGYIFKSSHAIKYGFQDLIVWTKTKPPVAVLVEVKRIGGKLTYDEEKWIEYCDKNGIPNCIGHEPEEVLDYMEMWDRLVLRQMDLGGE